MYQTGQLWFDEVSDHNFFYTVFVDSFFSKPVYSETEDMYVSKPKRVMTIKNFGNKQYVDLGSFWQGEELRAKAEQGIKQVLHKGQYMETVHLDWRVILSQKAIVYQYGMAVDMKAFAKEFEENPRKIEDKIKEFDQIVLIPSQNVTKELQCYFIDEKNNQAHRVMIKNARITKELYEKMDAIQKNKGIEDIILYSSTKQNNLDIFHKNIFLPDLHTRPYIYKAVGIKDPFIKDGELDKQSLEDFVDPFFDNPRAKWSGKDAEGNSVFADEYTIIKYYATGVVEYDNYSMKQERAYGSQDEAYGVVQRFLKNDVFVGDQFYLAQAKQENDGWQFYFNFYMGEFPYMISDVLAKEVGMDHGHVLEVFVQGNQVKHFKHFVRTTEMLYTVPKTAEVDFFSALDAVIAREFPQGVAEIKVQDTYLAYYQDHLLKSPQLMWMIRMEDGWYGESAVR